MAETKAAPAKKAEKASTETVVMKKNGVTTGKSGKVYAHMAGNELTVPAGEFDHLSEAHIAKK